jgi:hypothetical protein
MSGILCRIRWLGSKNCVTTGNPVRMAIHTSTTMFPEAQSVVLNLQEYQTDSRTLCHPRL